MAEHTPGRFYPELLDQSDAWIDRFGREWYFEDLERDYRENILLFLTRNALRFQKIYMREIDYIDFNQLPPPELVALDSITLEAAQRWMLRTEFCRALMGSLCDAAL